MLAVMLFVLEKLRKQISTYLSYIQSYLHLNLTNSVCNELRLKHLSMMHIVKRLSTKPSKVQLHFTTVDAKNMCCCKGNDSFTPEGRKTSYLLKNWAKEHIKAERCTAFNNLACSSSFVDPSTSGMFALSGYRATLEEQWLHKYE